MNTIRGRIKFEGEIYSRKYGTQLLILVLYVLFAAVAVPLSSFYPFGTSYNDSTVRQTLDGGAPLNLSQSFVYFGVSYNLVYVSDYIYLYNSNFTRNFAYIHDCLLYT